MHAYTLTNSPIHMHTQTPAYTSMHTYMHAIIHNAQYTHTYTYKCLYIHTRTHTHTSTQTLVYTYAHTHIQTNTYAQALYMYIYTRVLSFVNPTVKCKLNVTTCVILACTDSFNLYLIQSAHCQKVVSNYIYRSLKKLQ